MEGAPDKLTVDGWFVDDISREGLQVVCLVSNSRYIAPKARVPLWIDGKNIDILASFPSREAAEAWLNGHSRGEQVGAR